MKTRLFLLLSSAITVSAIAGPAPENQTGSQTAASSISRFDSDFTFLRTHRQGKGTAISWGITSSTGVAAFQIERAYGDPSDPYAMWENVGSFSCNPSTSYKCNDENVYPGTISYRVVIVMTNGSRKISPVSTINIVSRHG